MSESVGCCMYVLGGGKVRKLKRINGVWQVARWRGWSPRRMAELSGILCAVSG